MDRKRSFSLVAVAIGLCSAALALLAPIAAFAGSAPPFQIRNIYVQGYADATATQTFATTSYADLAAATVQVTPAADPNRLNAPGTPAIVSRVHVFWSADVSKATATVGTCAVFVNGAILANSARSAASVGGQDSISGLVDVANTQTGTQTVKLQCKSGDTNVFTVNNANIYVETNESS